jgi:hypothetical protein
LLSDALAQRATRTKGVVRAGRDVPAARERSRSSTPAWIRRVMMHGLAAFPHTQRGSCARSVSLRGVITVIPRRWGL